MKLFLLSALLVVAYLAGDADADGHKLKPPGGQYNVTHILVTNYLTQYVNYTCLKIVFLCRHSQLSAHSII